MKAVVLPLLLATMACSSDGRIRPPDPAAIATLQQINQLGPRPIADSMARTPAYREWIADHVAQGDTTWLIVGTLLRSASEGGVSAALDLAFANAITRQPEVVLHLLGDSASHLTFAGVCRAEVVTDSLDVLKAETANRNHQMAMVAALMPVTSPDLIARRDSCQSAFNASAVASDSAAKARRR